MSFVYLTSCCFWSKGPFNLHLLMSLDMLLRTICKQDKFLYSAVSIPQDCSKRFTLYFAGRPVHSNIVSTSLHFTSLADLFTQTLSQLLYTLLRWQTCSLKHCLNFSTLYFAGRPVHSNIVSTSLGSLLPHTHLCQ